MFPPYGPHKITKVRQVSLPSELMREAGLEVGDAVYARVNPGDAETIELIPARVLARRYERGHDAETLERLTEQDTARRQAGQV